MGVPGLADLQKGITKLLPNLPGKWEGVDVRGGLQPRLECPVYLLNDVRSATLAEFTFGRKRQVDTMALFAVGTGIGGGVVIGGELRLGPLGQAGELGHQIVVPDGPLCGCGNRGCLEALASGTAITSEAVRLLIGGECPRLHELTGGDASKVDAGKVGEAAAAGDESMRWVLARAGYYIGIAACNVIVTIHPELVVIGGGVARVGDLLLEPIRRTVAERLYMMPVEDIRIEPSVLGGDAGMLGALACAEGDGLIGAA
jgi:glucokinase